MAEAQTFWLEKDGFQEAGSRLSERVQHGDSCHLEYHGAAFKNVDMLLHTTVRYVDQQQILE